MMILKCALVFLGLCSVTTEVSLVTTKNEENVYDDDDYLKSMIEWSELVYEGACEATAEAEWKLINNPTNGMLLHEWEQAQVNYRLLKNKEIAEIHNSTNTEPDSESLAYKLNIIKQPGDVLLNDTQWNKLISFSGKASILRTGVNHTGGSRREVEQLLSGTGNTEEKRSAWSNWHRELLPFVETYSSTLVLVAEAAKANDVNDVASYWELLSGYSEGYEKMEMMWEEIAELHKKLTTFVRNRLIQKYQITSENDEIPAYLLGSLSGYDWTPVAADVIPYGNVSYSIIKNLWEKDLRGRILYESASMMENSLLNDKPQGEFWDHSFFNQTCLSQFVDFCKEGLTRVSTCHQASLGNFLAAHKVVAKVVMSQKRSDGIPLLTMANRYSGLDVGISELFSILSVSPEQLHTLNLVDNTTDTDRSQITSLMITALDVLPRLAYYMVADFWRINIIRNGTFPANEFVETWWQYRKKYERMTNADFSDVPTFLDDDYITSNKPYLPKFLGTVLAFQLYEHVTGSTEVRYDNAERYQINHNLIEMIQKSGDIDWINVMYNVMETDEVTTDALLSFFRPLEEYLDSEQEGSYPLTVAQVRELDRLGKLYESIDVTSTTMRPTTTTRATNVITKASKTTDPSLAHEKTSTAVPSEKPLGKNENTSKKPNDGFFPGIEDVTEAASGESEYTDKMNTSKAVWAVAAVLIATVAICVIAIFGRRRCVKSQMPKNRRYV